MRDIEYDNNIIFYRRIILSYRIPGARSGWKIDDGYYYDAHDLVVHRFIGYRLVRYV